METVHKMKDYAKIYRECDEYKVNVWQPNEQRRMRLVFTGSSKPCDDIPEGEIRFNAYYTDNLGDNGVIWSFKQFVLQKGFAKNEEEAKEMLKEYMKLVIENRDK